jgi:uncharacterized repeat protein (TIGR01451 family)
MTRPSHLGPEYAWAGIAVPTGDAKTSVLTIEKIIPADVVAGRDYEYTIRVANVTKAPVENVVVTDDPQDTGFRMSGSQPAAQSAGSKLVWNLGTLAPGASTDIVVSGRSGSSGRLPSCATVNYKEAAPPKAATPAAAAAAAPAAAAAAKLELTVSQPAETGVGEDIPTKIVVKNTGNAPAKDVKVTNDLPAGWTADGKKQVTYDGGTIEPGKSKEYTVKSRAGGTGKGTSKVTATAAGGLSVSASSSESTVHKAVLVITKAASRPTVILTRPATFSITVKNTGDWPANAFTIKDAMAGAESISAVSDGGAASGSTVTWNLGSLAAGASRTVNASATRSTIGGLSDTATASATGAEPVSASASVNFIGVPAVLLELTDNPDPVAIGSTTTYTIKVTNQGTAPDSEVVVTCMMEDAVAFVSAAGASTGTHAGGKVTFAPLAVLKPKETAVWTVVVKGVKAADSRFKCELNTHETGRPIETQEATRIYE